MAMKLIQYPTVIAKIIGSGADTYTFLDGAGLETDIIKITGFGIRSFNAGVTITYNILIDDVIIASGSIDSLIEVSILALHLTDWIMVDAKGNYYIMTNAAQKFEIDVTSVGVNTGVAVMAIERSAV